ncbi:FAD-dependent oxidoreductase [Candidatus Wolfebacteria bacterium]|nr:FAD-dependent oxidoreductase [Candidatus Wolfebacteria bacterium]
MKIGILGGGLSGLALAYHLKHPTEILEAADRVGGLCKTIWKDGFGYDIGGHILFSKYQEINELIDKLLAGNLNKCKRANKILFNGRYIKYPFENDLGSLTKEDNYDCLIGYLQKNYPEPKTNLKEWAYYTFGKGIAEKYLIPYNEKIWNCSAEQLGLEWVERIPKPPMEDVVKSALGIETEGYQHQLYFRYPTFGGAEALVKALARDDQNIELNYKITKIIKKPSGWLITDGNSEKKYDRIVVSFPIHEAVACFENVPPQIISAVKNLRYNSINVIMLGVNNTNLSDKSAIYIPDKAVLPHRVCFMRYFSENMVPAGASSLIAEVTTNTGDGIHEMNDDEMIGRVKNDLNRVGIIDKKDVIASDLTRFTYGYPVHDINYRENIELVRKYFKDIDVDLCGRFAEFEYINMDECLKRAINLANKLNVQTA